MLQCVDYCSLASPWVMRGAVQVLVCVGRFPDLRGRDGSITMVLKEYIQERKFPFRLHLQCEGGLYGV